MKRDREFTAEAVQWAILTRHSIRVGFDGSAIPRDSLESIVTCGLAAPSSKNAQPFRFHVVTDRSLLSSIADDMVAEEDLDAFVPKDPATGDPRREYRSTVVESADILRQASAGIVIENLGKFSVSRQALTESRDGDFADILLGYALEVIGIGAAMENMWVCAHAMGIEGTFMGDPLVADSRIRAALGIQNDLAGILALGYASGARQDRRVVDVRGSDRVAWYEE
jgi:nitroreductase